MPRRKPKPTPLKKLKSVLRGKKPPAVKAFTIIKLAPKLPSSAIEVMDDALADADPIVQVAIMDAYYEMTEDRYHQQDLERILAKAAKGGDANEELYMAARLALGRVNGLAKDALGEYYDSGLEIVAMASKRAMPGKRREPDKSITVMIHGTWAADGKWWRPGGDFFNYVKNKLKLQDLYGGSDRFMWSGKNRDSSRKKAANSLSSWLHSHPATKINVFAHSHGANVAMLATHNDVQMNKLVMLSPPVRKDYYAKWGNVAEAFNIQAGFDPVVAIARGGQWFNLANVKEKELKANGHSASHDPKVWKDEKLGKFTGIPW